ncbi:MAG: DNA internalization-related competence protein ComEC/Rec2 [Eubacteriales bacterium]|nr:DNA internalization-related competence protein ComEC/Rec2 [Eubacteriales bacterium]
MKLYLFYFSLFILGYIRADIEYKIFNTKEAIEFYSNYIPSNPGEFDYALYLKSKGIHSEKMLDDSKNSDLPLSNIRNYALNKLSSSFDEEDAGVLRAMLIGDKSEMNIDLKNIYQKAGISHIISISGLHVSFAGMSFFMILNKLKAGIGISLFGASFFTIIYGFITGNAVSTVRAVIMLIIKYTGMYLGRGYDMITAILVSAVAIVFFRPYILLQSGFQLSFSAVIAISCVSGIIIEALKLYFDRELNKVVSALIVCISVQLVAFPILAYHFYELNLSSVIINIIIVPLAGFVIYSGMAVIFGGVITDIFHWMNFRGQGIYMLLGAPAHYTLKLFKNLAIFGNMLPLSTIRTGRPKGLQIAFYYILLFIIILTLKSQCSNRRVKNKRKVIISVLAAFLLFFLAPFILKRPCSEKLQIISLDVGQGDSCLIMDGKRSVLIDGGSSTSRDIYDEVIDKVLGFYGIKRLDTVIVSHADADHVNGIEKLIEDRDVGINMLILPKPAQNHEKYQRIIEKYYSSENKKPIYLKDGDVLHVGKKLSIKCIQEGIEDGEDVNRHSSFLMINYGNFNMLSSGDAVAEDEIRAASSINNELKGKSISFFKAGHHGSKGSNTRELIDLIRPQYVFFSCAKKNRYGHPDRGVVDLCKEKGAKCLYSYSHGAIIVECSEGHFEVMPYKML